MNNYTTKKIIANSSIDSGLSFIEMIVTVSVFTIVILAINSLVVSFYRYNAYGFEQSSAIDSAGRGIEPTINNIRELTYSDEGAYPIISASANSFSFYSDIDTDDNVEKIRLFVDGDILKKSVIKSAGDPLTYGGQPETIFTLSDSVRNIALAMDIFSYYDSSGVVVLDLSDVSNIAFVTMNVTININPVKAPNDFTLRASAAFRNLRKK